MEASSGGTDFSPGSRFSALNFLSDKNFPSLKNGGKKRKVNNGNAIIVPKKNSSFCKFFIIKHAESEKSLEKVSSFLINKSIVQNIGKNVIIKRINKGQELQIEVQTEKECIN